MKSAQHPPSFPTLPHPRPSTHRMAVDFDPDVWGPLFWDMLFTLAFQNAGRASAHAPLHRLLQLLDFVIPCSYCRKSYMVFRQGAATLPVAHDDDEWAAKWLWTAHDYVNQKAGKACMSYETLRRRHRTFTHVLHDFVLFDIFVIVHRASPPSRAARVREFVALALELQCAAAPRSELPEIMGVGGGELACDRDDQLLATHAELYRRYGRQPLTTAEFHHKYGHAVADTA